MKIAIQGLDTSFHAFAARRIFGDDAELVPGETFKAVFEALNNKLVDYAVVAIENSLYGSINDVYDLLLEHDFNICGETYEEIGLHLLGTQSATLDGITDVYSHFAALGESDVFLDRNLPNAERHEHADTALAAQDVAKWNDPTKAAISGTAAAEKYSLKYLAKNIETHSNNYTRFIALSRHTVTDENANKTTVTFRTQDVPGALYKTLGIFAKQNVNLTKLESRPIVGSAWRYMYYLDFNASAQSEVGKQILEKLPRVASEVRILGSYQAGEMVKV